MCIKEAPLPALLEQCRKDVRKYYKPSSIVICLKTRRPEDWWQRQSVRCIAVIIEPGHCNPADRQVGQDAIIPAAINGEEARERLGAFEKVLPYLRKVRQA